MAKKREEGTPTVPEALRALLQEEWDDETDFDRLSIRVRRTGEVAYRLYPRDGGEYEGGVCVVS